MRSRNGFGERTSPASRPDFLAEQGASITVRGVSANLAVPIFGRAMATTDQQTEATPATNNGEMGAPVNALNPEDQPINLNDSESSPIAGVDADRDKSAQSSMGMIATRAFRSCRTSNAPLSR